MRHNQVDTGRKLNVHNVLCTFNLRPVSTGIIPSTIALYGKENKLKTNKLSH